MRRSKLYKSQVGSFEASARYSVKDALNALKAMPAVKFDQTVEAAFRLGIDPRKSDQNVRGAVALPSGTGKSVRVAVVCDGPQADAAKAAGADFVGYEDLVEQIKEIVKIKKDDINARDEEAAIRVIAGTARSMGIEVI